MKNTGIWTELNKQSAYLSSLSSLSSALILDEDLKEG